ncbi:MAG: hypothetical protein GXP29_06555 [Planctomycetes bacterium]|nr:hypothetical protein [Planctomycetota bacterium]
MSEPPKDTIHDEPNGSRAGRICAAVMCALSAFFMGPEYAPREFSTLYGGWVVQGTALAGGCVAAAIFLKGCTFLRRRPIGSPGFSRVMLWALSYGLGAMVSPVFLKMGIAKYAVETRMDYVKFNEFLSAEFPPKYHLSYSGDVWISVRRGDADALEEFLDKADVFYQEH